MAPYKLLLAGKTRTMLEALARIARERMEMEVIGPIEIGHTPIELQRLRSAVEKNRPDAVIATMPERLTDEQGRELMDLLRGTPALVVMAIDAIDPNGTAAIRTLVLAKQTPAKRLMEILDAALPRPGDAQDAKLPRARAGSPGTAARDFDSVTVSVPATPPARDEAAKPYEEESDHFEDEIRWVRLRLLALVSEEQAVGADTDGERDGLLRLLAPEHPSAPHDLADAAVALRSHIDGRRERTAQGKLRLERVVTRMHLDTSFERGAFVFCMAFRADPAVRRACRWLDRRSGVAAPSTDLLLRALTSSASERAHATSCLAASSRLRAGALLLPSRPDPMRASWRVDPSIADHVLFGEFAWVQPGETVHPERDGVSWSDPDTTERLARLLQARTVPTGEERDEVVLTVRGREGSGRRALFANAASAAGIPLVSVEMDDFLRAPDFETAVRRAARSCRLYGAALFVDRFDRVMEDAVLADERLRTIFAALHDHCLVAGLASDGQWRHRVRLGETLVVEIDVPEPDESALAQVWTGEFESQGWSYEPDEVAQLSAKFRLLPGHVRAAADDARAKALLDRGATSPTVAELHAAARVQRGRGLDRYATRIDPRYRWEDLVLPDDQMRQLREIESHVRLGGTVYSAWGFRERHPRSEGLATLFSGPSGTGKSMAAEVLANELEIELWRIDLSLVASKYIGETSKHLSEIFSLAEGGGILFFDEADALFGKRTEVKDAHDRYANLEAAFLLTRMEDYRGVSVLATNLRQNFDPAVIRRIRVCVEFSEPDPARRERIWRNSFPGRTPVDADVDFRFLATRLDVTGGSIRNIALRAAFLAAADPDARAVGMRHVVRAAASEMTKIGRAVDPAALVPYEAEFGARSSGRRLAAAGARP